MHERPSCQTLCLLTRAGALQALDAPLLCQMLRAQSYGREQLRALVGAVGAALEAASLLLPTREAVCEWWCDSLERADHAEHSELLGAVVPAVLHGAVALAKRTHCEELTTRLRLWAPAFKPEAVQYERDQATFYSWPRPLLLWAALA